MTAVNVERVPVPELIRRPAGAPEIVRVWRGPVTVFMPAARFDALGPEQLAELGEWLEELGATARLETAP